VTVKRKVKENAVEKELVARVEAMGGRCEKVRVIGRRGFFDRLVVLPAGKIIFAECKRPKGGRISAHQGWYLQSFSALGAAIAIVKNSADIDRLLASAKK
jgi:hypothetical protein